MVYPSDVETPFTDEDTALARSRARTDAVDPRAALASLGAIVVFALAAPTDIVAMLALLSYTALVYAVLAGRPAELARQSFRLLPVALFVVLINGWVVDGTPLLSVAGRFVISAEGVSMGLFFAARLAVMVLAVGALLHLVPPEAFASAVFALLRPFSRRLARRLAFHAFVAMSFAPLFADEIDRIRIAQSFRGGALGNRRALWRNAVALRLWIVPLLVSAIRRSEDLAAVVELRGLRDRIGEVSFARRARAADFAFVIITVLVLFACEFWLGSE